MACLFEILSICCEPGIRRLETWESRGFDQRKSYSKPSLVDQECKTLFVTKGRLSNSWKGKWHSSRGILEAILTTCRVKITLLFIMRVWRQLHITIEFDSKSCYERDILFLSHFKETDWRESSKDTRLECIVKVDVRNPELGSPRGVEDIREVVFFGRQSKTVVIPCQTVFDVDCERLGTELSKIVFYCSCFTKAYVFDLPARIHRPQAGSRSQY